MRKQEDLLSNYITNQIHMQIETETWKWDELEREQIDWDVESSIDGIRDGNW